MLERNNRSLDCIRQQLSHIVSLSPLPIADQCRFDVAIIASVFRESHEDLTRYSRYLVSEFSNSPDVNVQVLFADNTPSQAHSDDLSRMQTAMKPSAIDFVHLHAPTPGKIHGLNTCLRFADAPFILSVDLNKQPQDGALMGIYRGLESGEADLISARLVGAYTQHWNAGAAYGATRACFAQEFPPVLNEDEFMLRLTLARCGSFKVSQFLFEDLKGKGLSRHDHMRRLARTQVGSLQIDTLTVVDGKKQYDLHQHNTAIPLCSDGGQGDVCGSIYTQGNSTVGFIRSYGSRIRHGLSDRRIYQEYMGQLLKNPQMCAW